MMRRGAGGIVSGASTPSHTTTTGAATGSVSTATSPARPVSGTSSG